MARYKILAVAESEEVRLNIRDQLSQYDDIALVGFAAADADLASKIKGYAPHAVLLAQDQEDADFYDLAQRIYQEFPGCAMVLILDNLTIDSVRSAMQAGIREVIGKDNLDALHTSLIKAARMEQSRASGTQTDPRVVSFFSGRGGVGKTTMAVNSAIALALSGQRTMLVDLNLAFGDAALLLNIKTKDTLAELVQEKSSFSIDDIRSFSMQHPAGISFLSAPASPEHAEYITARHIELLINQLRPYYDFIVLDLPCDISDTTIAAIEASDILVMTSRKDMSGLKVTRQMLDIFTTLQLGDKIRLLLNLDKKSVLSQKDMERVLDRSFDYVLGEDIKTAQSCQERGAAFVYEMPRSALSRGVQKMVQSWINEVKRESDI